jgi:hypothetical protein
VSVRRLVVLSVSFALLACSGAGEPVSPVPAEAPATGGQGDAAQVCCTGHGAAGAGFALLPGEAPADYCESFYASLGPIDPAFCSLSDPIPATAKDALGRTKGSSAEVRIGEDVWPVGSGWVVNADGTLFLYQGEPERTIADAWRAGLEAHGWKATTPEEGVVEEEHTETPPGKLHRFERGDRQLRVYVNSPCDAAAPDTVCVYPL